MAGVVLLTADYCVGLYDSMERGLPSVGHVVFYLSLLAYLLLVYLFLLGNYGSYKCHVTNFGYSQPDMT